MISFQTIATIALLVIVQALFVGVGGITVFPYTNGAQEPRGDISLAFKEEQFTVSRYLVSLALTSIYPACPGFKSKLVYFTVVTHPKTPVQRVVVVPSTNN